MDDCFIIQKIQYVQWRESEQQHKTMTFAEFPKYMNEINVIWVISDV